MGRDSFFKTTLLGKTLTGLSFLFLLQGIPGQAVARPSHSGGQHSYSAASHDSDGVHSDAGHSVRSTPSDNKKSSGFITITANNITVSTLQQSTTNREVIVLKGNGDTVTASQLGVSNKIRIVETGTGDSASVSQSGVLNVANIVQIGSNSTGLIGQFGVFNKAAITQIGLSETAGVGQLGHVNSSSITQLASLPVHVEALAPTAAPTLPSPPPHSSNHNLYYDAPLNLLDLFFPSTLDD